MTMPFYVPPEQLIKDRAEFARKGIQRGRPIGVVEYDGGILLIGENPNRSLHKTGEIYDHLAFAGVYAYARADVTGKGLANAYSQTLGQIFTHEVKPYEVEVVVAELGDDDNHLFHVRYDGTLRDKQDFAVIGGDEDRLVEEIGAGYRPDMSLSDTIGLTMTAIQNAPPEHWEAGVLDRSLGRRKFRRLTPNEITPSD